MKLIGMMMVVLMRDGDKIVISGMHGVYHLTKWCA